MFKFNFKVFSFFKDTGICQYTLLTPLNPQERGAQLSFRPHGITAQQIHDELEKVGVVVSTNINYLILI